MRRMDGEDGSHGVSEKEVELVRMAKDAFASHRYESCLSALNRLMESRRNDARVAHNRAVAQYLLSNLTLTDEFRKTLNSVNSQFDHDADSCGTEASKGVLLFNQALIYMRLRQHSRTMHLLEQLFKVHDALDDSLVAQICLLQIETYIQTYQLDKATEQVEFLEGRLFGGALPSVGGGGAGNEGDGGVERGYRQQLCLFRARLNLLRKNVNMSKKELKGFVAIAGNIPSAQFLKANIEYLRHNSRKALKVLGSVPKSPIDTDSGECLSAFYFNNVGCVHFQLGKFCLAAHYFHKALEENDAALNGFPSLDRATPLSGRPLAVLGVNCRHILLYNLGIQQLYAGHPLAAFDSLLEVVQVYHTNPRLWLRLAEACIASHAKSQQDRVPKRMNKSETVQMMFGSGQHRKMALVPIQNWIVTPAMDSATQSAAMPAPTLEFAAVCLRNALFLLPPSTDSSRPPVIATTPSPPTLGEGIISLRCSVLACMAYVALGLGDPVMALSYTKQLLSSPHLPGGLRFLGHLYAAEALVYLSRIDEAIQFLNPDAISSVSTSDTTPEGVSEESSQTGSVSKFPCTIARARATTFFNLASVFCIRKEHEKARKALQQAISLFGADIPAQAVLLSVYIEIMSGNVALALQIVKQHQPFSQSSEQKRAKKLPFVSLS